LSSTRAGSGSARCGNPGDAGMPRLKPRWRLNWSLSMKNRFGLPGRRAIFAYIVAGPAIGCLFYPHAEATEEAKTPADSADAPTVMRWQHKWERDIANAALPRYCDTENGEEIGWLMSPVLDGFYYAFRATGHTIWVDRLIEWTDAWVRRGVREPDGHLGWPKIKAAGTDVDNLNTYYADSLLGEAMALRPVVLMAATIRSDASLNARYGLKADSYISLSRQIFDKWNSRGAWRPVRSGIISIVLPFGIDRATGNWTRGYGQRNDFDQGFSHPANKANLIAMWLLAMHDATGDRQYLDRATGWFQLMLSRMTKRDNGTFGIWNYWQPTGRWDFRTDGGVKHWVGRHPNPGYYTIDVRAIVTAYQHQVAFKSSDIARLAKTASDNHLVWPDLANYDEKSRQSLEAMINAGGWPTLALTPWYLALRAHRLD
jgi:hypothetical protein